MTSHFSKIIYQTSEILREPSVLSRNLPKEPIRRRPPWGNKDFWTLEPVLTKTPLIRASILCYKSPFLKFLICGTPTSDWIGENIWNGFIYHIFWFDENYKNWRFWAKKFLVLKQDKVQKMIFETFKIFVTNFARWDRL